MATQGKGGHTMSRRLLLLLALLALVVGILAPASAGAASRGDEAGGLSASPDGVSLDSTFTRPATSINGGKLVAVVIELEEEPVASYEGDRPGLAATSPSVTGESIDANSSNVRRYRTFLSNKFYAFANTLRTAVPRTQIRNPFQFVIGGLSALVPENSIDAIRKMPGVVGVYRDTLLQLDTEASPEFIGADVLWDQLGGQQNAGEGVVVGVLDSGIWPEHPSFSDPDPFGNAYPAPSVAPGSNGWGSGGARSTCDFGNTAFNPNDAPFACNNKLIGAYDFTDTYQAVVGVAPGEYDSARDADGHGTHTTSTAAGNGGVEATLLGVDRGVVSGIAPRAHVIHYKVCHDEGCFGSDSARAIEQAILDDVDVLNFSISGGGDPYNDIVSLAFLGAYDAGVLGTPSAGNSGPGADTVAHREPWTLTVGASTSDRHFVSTVTLEGLDGDLVPQTLELDGATVTGGIDTATPVIFPPPGEELCLDPFAPATFSGEIVICERGQIARVAKSFNVAEGDAGGMLLYNPVLQGLATDNHFVPSVHLENDAGAALLDFMANHTDVTATFTDGVATEVLGDKMAAFSSRGGPGQTLGISKPDVTAPGVQILAGHTPTPFSEGGGLPGELFQSIQGTSMSAPHAAGAAALVKAAHPDWTPGQIKSALMMTASRDVVKEDGTTPADAFDMGSGSIRPAAAADAGLTISESAANFAAMQFNLWDANYPSLYIPQLYGELTVERTVHDETGSSGMWRTRVHAPGDLDISVPSRIWVPANGDKTFEINVDGRTIPDGATRQGWIEIYRGSNSLWFPVTAVKVPFADELVSLTKTCDPTEIDRYAKTSCEIVVQNNAFEDANVAVVDRMPRQLYPLVWTIRGAGWRNGVINWDGTLSPAEAPKPDVVVDPLASPYGYVALAGFTPTDVGATDESIANFNVPPFEFAGEVYSQIGIVSNGYVVVGGGTGADVDFINTDLPDPSAPNNTLAPFWTDLNPAAGGRVLVAVLTDGVDTWIIVEWESVPNWGDGETNTAQVWIGIEADANPGEDIFFVYGPDVSDGDSGFLTVGVENGFGNEGGSVYFDGVGTPPSPSFPNAAPGYEVDVFSVPGEPGETHTITFDAWGVRPGDWTNWAQMTSDLTPGISYAGASGTVNNTWPPARRGL